VVLEGAGETQYSFATTLLRRPTRDSPAPDWPLSMEQKVWRGVLAVALAVGAVGAGVTLRRRRRQQDQRRRQV
jgi:hypothetical protein